MKTNKESAEYLSILSEREFICGINSVTRPKENNGSCIDHIFYKINNKNSVKTYVIHSLITDHYITSIVIRNNKFICKNLDKKIISYKKIKSLAEKVNWQEIMNYKKVDEAAEILVNKIQSLIYESQYIKKPKKKNKPRKIWITKGLIKSCIHKQKL